MKELNLIDWPYPWAILQTVLLIGAILGFLGYFYVRFEGIYESKLRAAWNSFLWTFFIIGCAVLTKKYF